MSLNPVTHKLKEFAHNYIHTWFIWGAFFSAMYTALEVIFRWIAGVSITRSVYGFIIRLFESLANYIDQHPALFALIIICSIILFIMHLIHLRRMRDGHRRTYDIINSSIEAHFVFVSNIATLLDSRSTHATLERVDREIINYLKDVCDSVASTFSHQTRSQCYACIKSFEPISGTVRTFARDRRSIGRDISDQALAAYQYKQNTALHAIIDNEAVGLYCNNYLRVSMIMGSYQNANSNWSKLYRATCVGPVAKSQATNRINKDTVRAFICVDNLEGRFKPGTAGSILRIYSYFVFETMLIAGTIS